MGSLVLIYCFKEVSGDFTDSLSNSRNVKVFSKIDISHNKPRPIYLILLSLTQWAANESQSPHILRTSQRAVTQLSPIHSNRNELFQAIGSTNLETPSISMEKVHHRFHIYLF
ncbi:hypothetical protein TNCV_1878121 [Trichonephila clavipes]|nr:hypothetical protein TNCV_1878121 [Trichonephila clavipes]